jgi:hypothetical protein
MSWIENRLNQAESKLENLYRRVLDLAAAVRSAAQTARAASQQASGSPGGSGGTAYVCVPSASVPAATAAPGAGTPGSLGGQTIYQVSSGAYTSVTTSGTISNVSPSSSLASGKVTLLGQNPDGTYTALSQVC